VERPLASARESGLIRVGEPLLVLLSGGGDSVCLIDVAVRLGAAVSALHVNYGLRAAAAAEEAHCRELCERLSVALIVEHAELSDEGNLQAQARDLRYACAERHAGGDYATAHTVSDQAETVLYRLAVSPGRRALLGMAARRGRLVRPLLEVTSEETRAYCRERGLSWREDASNVDRRFARARIRQDVLPALRELNPAAESTIAQTSALLRDEADVLETVIAPLAARAAGAPIVLAELRAQPPAVRRLLLRRIAEATAGAGAAVALPSRQVDLLVRLGERGGSASVDLGGGLCAVAEYGVLRFTRAREAQPPEPVALAVPGVAHFGEWEIEARRGTAGDVVLAAAAVGRSVTVRGWRRGDRIRPAGLGGSKSLQDLFTDQKVPRALRGTLPVVEIRGEIAWVAGVAVAERFRAPAGCDEVVSVSARRSAHAPVTAPADSGGA